ncbi:MAG: FtsW/RodA/SpoVE family cell cycle protein [Kineosporiaceae bacterium]|nr:FtsW/RodA/SpoVE family cell cycle protein [Kineosporiaceae bacterium]
MWAAAVLARKQAMVGQVAHALIPVVPGALVLLALVMVGNDLGTALVLVAITVALLFTAGVPLRLFAVGGLLGGLAITLLVTTSENRMKRVNTWLGNTPCEYLSTCWQPTHSRYALATGGWWGVGLGAGREKWLWLSQAHNDFIFAVIGEELGLIGTLTVLALFAALGIGLFKLVIASDDTFVKIATGGVLAWVLGQAIINIGTVLGMLPVIGLPLPLVSSGGSALVTVMIAFGMVLGFARQVPGAPGGARGTSAYRRSNGVRALAPRNHGPDRGEPAARRAR